MNRSWDLIVVGLLVMLGACSASEGAPADDSPAVRVVNVEIETVTPRAFVDWIRLTGEVEAMYDVTLAAEESGRVERFHVTKGRPVRAGAVIAELDDTVLRAQMAEARAQAELAAEQFERQRRLWEDEGMGTEIAFLEARARAVAARARLEILEARLAHTRIRAPVDGIFDERFVEVGEMATPGLPIARIVSVDRVKVTGGVPERYALAVTRGDSARISFDVLPNREFTGRVDFVGTSVDPSNRTVPIEILMTNPGGVVKPRMIATVQVVRARLDSTLVVPQEVVRRVEAGYQLLVAVPQDQHTVAEARSVTLGPAYRNEVVITSGLAPGDQVITVGSHLADHGSRIRVVAERVPAAGARTEEGR